MKYLLELSQDKDSIKLDSELLPVTTFNYKDNKNKSDNSKENKNDNDKYSFFASFKKNRNL